MQMSGFGILPDIALSSAVNRGLSGVIIGDEEIITIELRPHLLIIEALVAIDDRILAIVFLHQPTHRFTLYGDTTYIIPRPTPANTTRLPKETKVYFNPFFITFYLLVVFRGTKIVNLSETA